MVGKKGTGIEWKTLNMAIEPLMYTLLHITWSIMNDY